MDSLTILSPFGTGEAARLYDLRSLNILDTPREPLYDSIVEVAASLFEVPMAFISLVDEERQWIKASCGVEFCSTDRAVSFCAHAIKEPEPMVIEDARHDHRFAHNPFVTGEMGIRFYAGIPLVTSRRQCVGTLCVADVRARRFGEGEVVLLQKLARVVVAAFETRRVF